MFWEKLVDDKTTKSQRRIAKVTFRLPKADFLWVSGCITETTSISKAKGTELTFSVSNKARGQLLNVRTMVAIASEDAMSFNDVNLGTQTDDKKDMSDLTLTFEKEYCKHAEFFCTVWWYILTDVLLTLCRPR